MAEILDSISGLGPSLDLVPNDTISNGSDFSNQTYFAPYEVPVEIVALLSLFYGAISLVAVLGNFFSLLSRTTKDNYGVAQSIMIFAITSNTSFGIDDKLIVNYFPPN